MTARTTSTPWSSVPSIIMTGAVLLIMGGIAMGYYDKNLYQAQKGREAEVHARILAATVTAAVSFGDSRAAQEYVNALKANPETEAVAVYGNDGKPLASFVRDSQDVPAKVEDHGPAYTDNDVSVVVPVNENGALVGQVYLRAITESPERRTARYGVIMLFAIMAGLMLTVVGLAQRILARTNRELESKAAGLADANRRLQSEMEERALAEEALRQSQKMEAIGQLSGGIAHDFNNLLMIIKGNLQLMQKRVAAGQLDIQRYVDNATDGLTRAARLTQQILAFSRRQPLSPTRVTFNELVANIDNLLRHSVGTDVAIETRLDAQWPIICDANQMENVILNLAINARDAMPQGGLLKIETSDLSIPEGSQLLQDGMQAGDYVRLQVIDSGTGMPDDVIKRAIDPFFTTKPFGHGTGLGLSMAFGFVRQSHGHLYIDSEVGKGTTVTILLPRANETVTA